MYRTLKLEIAKAVATVTLNRPEARNAMSTQLMREMITCAGRIAARRDVDVVILRGAGRHFSAGRDLVQRLQRLPGIRRDAILHLIPAMRCPCRFLFIGEHRNLKAHFHRQRIDLGFGEFGELHTSRLALIRQRRGSLPIGLR